MSRSRKKHPICQICGDKSYKTIYNRRFRHKKDLDFPSGNAYRKTGESYDICDWKVGYFSQREIPKKPRQYWWAMK